mmetsp:Transcript_57348/g.153627  ORF Transcript_57348/g.153627 Transcript_57348/m.153627 type:complete len:223 (-) Transcript_57348:269-937(-)
MEFQDLRDCGVPARLPGEEVHPEPVGCDVGSRSWLCTHSGPMPLDSREGAADASGRHDRPQRRSHPEKGELALRLWGRRGITATPLRRHSGGAGSQLAVVEDARWCPPGPGGKHHRCCQQRLLRVARQATPAGLHRLPDDAALLLWRLSECRHSGGQGCNRPGLPNTPTGRFLCWVRLVGLDYHFAGHCQRHGHLRRAEAHGQHCGDLCARPRGVGRGGNIG